MKQTKVNKLITMLIVFVMMFSNFGFTISAIATSNGFEIITNGFFEKDEISFEAYFEEDGKELDEKIADVNKTMKLKMKVTPEEDGYLKNATIKAVSESGNMPNFRITDVQTYSTDLELKQDGGFNLPTNLEENDVQSEEVESTTDNTLENTVAEIPATTESVDQEEDTVQNEVVEESKIDKETELNLSKTVSVSGTNSVSEQTANTVENEVVDSSEEKQEDDTNTISDTEVEEEKTVANTVEEDSTNTVSNEEEDTAENTVENTVTDVPEATEEEEILIDEEKVIEEKSAEAEEATVDFTSDVQILSDNEISITNVIEETVYILEIEYVQEETLKVEDLYKEIHMQLSGTFINSDLEKVEVAKEDLVLIGWEYNKDITLSSEYTKFSPFKIGEKIGTIVENKITIKRDVQEEKYLPLKTTLIEIGVPKFNGKLPIEVSVTANKLLATTGEDLGQVTFNDENWKYENEKITITVNNENNGIAKNTNGEDEYTVIYRFEDYTEEISSKLNRNVNLTVEQYSAKENKIIKKEIKDNQEIDVNVGELVTYSIDSNEEKIQKSRIYANYNSQDALHETEYTSHVAVNILTSDMLEKLKIDCSKEIYKDVNGYEFKAEGIAYKNIKFNYSDVKHILEKGGNIEIYNQSNELLYTLDNNLIQKEEDCSININYANGIYIVVNNIAVNGTINFEMTKVIKKCNYDKAAFKNFTEIESRITAEVKYSNIDQTLTLEEIKTTKAFNESYTRANLYMNKENLTTIQENENVELRVELNNDKEDSDLYINPNFEFVFPKYVKEVHVESMNLLYENGLRIADFETYTESDIVKMRVELSGTQTMFSENTVTNGTNILINVKMKLDEYTPSKEDQIKLYYCNEGVSNYESQTKWTISKQIPNGILKTTNGFDVALFNYQAPNGLVAINGIRNYDGDLSEIKSVRQGETMKQIPMNDSSRIATMDLLTLNNTGNECSDLVMIGRIPFKGNKDVVSGKDLGTTTTGIMKDFIKEDIQNANMAIIYYSENPNATKSVEDGANGWRIATGVTDLSAIRSYMIVVKGNVKPGAVLKYNYDFEIPANLPYEVSMAGSFGAYYNNNTDVAVVYESTVADKVGVKTEPGPKVEATLSVDVGDGTEVGECRFLNYALVVKNTGSVTAENITITNPVPEYTQLYTYTSSNGFGNDNYVSSNEKSLSWSIDKLEIDEEKTYTYVLKTGTIPNIISYYGKETGKQIQQDEQGYYYEEVVDIEYVEKEIEQEPILNEKTGEYYTPEPEIIIEEIKKTEKVYVSEVPDIFIKNKATIKVGNLAIEKESNETSNLLKESKFDIEVNTEWRPTLSVGSKFLYMSTIKNISEVEQKNVRVVCKLPNTVNYIEPEVYRFNDTGEGFNIENVDYNQESHTVTFLFERIDSNEIVNAYIRAEVVKGDNSEIDTYYSILTEDGVEEKSSVLKRIYAGPKLQVKQDTNIVGESVLEGENVEFLITIENIGNGAAQNLRIADEISEKLDNITAEITGDIQKTVTIKENKIDEKIYSLRRNGKIVLKISGIAKDLEEGREEIIKNTALISSEYHDTLKTEEISIIIKENPNKEESEDSKKPENSEQSGESDNSQSDNEKNPQNGTGNEDVRDEDKDSNKDNGANNDNYAKPDEEKNPSNSGHENKNDIIENNQKDSNTDNKTNSNNNDNSSNKLEEKTYSLSGYVWLDKNKNGGKDVEEENISSVKVQLLKSGTMIKATTTDGSGKYEFKGLLNGSYSVIFIYDGEFYTATTYKNKNATEDLSSKAIESKEGNAVTSNLEIFNGDISNINLGLIKREVFNLSINKYVTKSIVKTKKGENVVEYDNLQLGKVEIKAKELKDANVSIEYAIVIKNEGEISGNATTIVDYIPKDMILDTSQNKGWYLGEDGNAYNDSLKDIVIHPGETKELKIMLTKQMNEKNTGVVSNKVTIIGTENQKGATEVKEDSTNTQEMMILISTGKTAKNIAIAAFITIVIISIAIAIKQHNILENIKKIKLKKIYK